MIRNLFFLVLIYLWLFVVFALQGQSMIKSQVTDQNKQPIEFVNVVLFSMPDTIFITGTTSLKDGSFGLTIHTPGSYMLQTSFIGYKKQQQRITIRKENITLPAIILEEESQALNEITITASRPIFNIKNGVLTTEVENTLLSREHSMVDVLSQIPGIINNRGTLEVFGSGQPVVYINNRKVQNMNEVSQLDVKNIRNIELITNPGARYDADVNAVIRIYTLEKEEGVAVKVNTAFRQSKKTSHYENIQIDYKKQKLNASVYYNFFGYKNKSFQYLIKDIQTDTLWQYVTDRTSYPFQKFHTFRMNVDYEFSPNHIVGMQFNEEYSNVDDNSKEVNTVNANQKRYLDFFVTSDYGSTIHNPQLNIFHNARWNEHLTSELNADYVFYKNTLEQDVKEETENDELLTQMSSLSRYTIYAARYAANYHPSEKHSIIAGVDVSRINGEGDMTTEPALVGYLNYKSKETKWAVFTEYNWTKTKLSLNTGLRYEVLSSLYDDLISAENNVKKKYHNIFPSFKISYSDKGVNNSLSFSVRTQRPQLSYLNSKTYYQNQFMYQQGNSNLKPQTSYILQWISGYKFLNFTASYTRTDDFISNIFTNPENGQNIIISTWDNFDKARFLRATLNLRHTFNIWTPSLTLGFIKPYMENEYNGVTTTYNKPNYYVSSNNYFKLPFDYTLSANYYYNHGGSQRIFEFKPFQSLDIKIQKPFFNERLSVDIGAKDIFRKLKYEENAQFNNIRFYQIENYSSWNFLSISFTGLINRKSSTGVKVPPGMK